MEWNGLATELAVLFLIVWTEGPVLEWGAAEETDWIEVVR